MSRFFFRSWYSLTRSISLSTSKPSSLSCFSWNGQREGLVAHVTCVYSPLFLSVPRSCSECRCWWTRRRTRRSWCTGREALSSGNSWTGPWQLDPPTTPPREGRSKVVSAVEAEEKEGRNLFIMSQTSWLQPSPQVFSSQTGHGLHSLFFFSPPGSSRLQSVEPCTSFFVCFLSTQLVYALEDLQPSPCIQPSTTHGLIHFESWKVIIGSIDPITNLKVFKMIQITSTANTIHLHSLNLVKVTLLLPLLILLTPYCSAGDERSSLHLNRQLNHQLSPASSLHLQPQHFDIEKSKLTSRNKTSFFLFLSLSCKCDHFVCVLPHIHNKQWLWMCGWKNFLRWPFVPQLAYSECVLVH